jgi:hypothetical protein
MRNEYRGGRQRTQKVSLLRGLLMHDQGVSLGTPPELALLHFLTPQTEENPHPYHPRASLLLYWLHSVRE